MNCGICEKIGKRELSIVYEDEKAVAFLSSKPSVAAHLIVAPKEHFTILEQVPDFLVAHLFVIANKLSAACFDALHMQGTNILINNGVAAGQSDAHFIIHVIPRIENDSLNFQWQNKQLDEEEMSTIELMLKEQTKNICSFQKEEKAPIVLEKNEEQIEIKKDEENYMIKQLRRMP